MRHESAVRVQVRGAGPHRAEHRVRRRASQMPRTVPPQTVSGVAVDKAGNASVLEVSVSIDKTKPLITAIRTPANAYGWNNSDVTVTFTCADTQSGITACTSPVTVTAEGADHVVTGSATNGAGNTATTTVSGISIDKTPPLITASVTTSPNAAGWYNTAPTIHFTCTDALAGIAECPGDMQVTSEGPNQTISATATDRAGNTADITVTGLNVDLSPPMVTITGAIDGATYALDQEPTFGCTTTDTTSGVATQATPIVTRTAGGIFTATCSGATDIADNSAAPTSITYTVVPTAPTLAALTSQYVSGTGANGVIENLTNKLMHGQICQYITKVTMESGGTNPTLTTEQAGELIYWARIIDPNC